MISAEELSRVCNTELVMAAVPISGKSDQECRCQLQCSRFHGNQSVFSHKQASPVAAIDC